MPVGHSATKSREVVRGGIRSEQTAQDYLQSVPRCGRCFAPLLPSALPSSSVPPPDSSSLHRASPRTGMASVSLIRVIHDLRGPLNTLAILGEVLRSSGAEAPAAHRDAIQTIHRAVNNLGSMLLRVRECVETMVAELEPVGMRVTLQSAIAATSIPGVDILLAPDEAPEMVLSCRERLPVTLGSLLACCAATLPGGGQLHIRVQSNSTTTMVTVTPSGPSLQIPPAHSFHKLSPERPGNADWFELCCRVEGLGGVLLTNSDSMTFSVTATFPSCP